MASSFELGDEQPLEEKQRKKKNENDSFHKLFGPPSALNTFKQIVDNQEEKKMEKITSAKKPLPGELYCSAQPYLANFSLT